MKEVFLSKHASERAQQRGVSRETIALRALHGKRIHVKEGKYQRIIRKPEAIKLVALKASLPQSLLDSTKGLRIVTSESENQVIVVWYCRALGERNSCAVRLLKWSLIGYGC